MSSKHSSEVKANIERAQQAVDAARKLASDGFMISRLHGLIILCFMPLQRYC
jgi:hypothetical protein